MAAPGRNTGPWAAANEAWRFTPSGAPNYTVEWFNSAGTLITTGLNATVSPPAAGDTYKARVTYLNCNGASTVVEDDITISRPSIGQVSLSAPQQICEGEIANLQIRGAPSYSWAPDPDISSTTDSNQTVSPTVTTTYNITATFPGDCKLDTSITVTVTPNPTVTANDATICRGDTATLFASGADTYTWKNVPGLLNNTGSSVQANPTVSSIFTVYGTTAAGCKDTFDLNITVLDKPQANAGADQTICGLTTTLDATLDNSNSAGLWSAPSGLFLSSNSAEKASLTASTYGTYTLSWAENLNGCETRDSVSVTFLQEPVPDAGRDDSICGNMYQLSANSSGFPGTWTSNNPNATFNNANDPNAQVVIPPSTGPVTFTWTESNQICTASDQVEISFYNLPSSNAGSDQVVCGNNTQLNALTNVGLGTWSAFNLNGSPAVVTYTPDEHSPTAFVSAASFDTIKFIWTMDQGVCVSKDSIDVVFYAIPEADAGANDTTCSVVYNLNATPSNGIGSWQILSGSGQINNPNSPNAQVINGSGDVSVVWEENSNGCIDSDTVDLHFIQVPAYSAGQDLETCANQVSLSGSAPGGMASGRWKVLNASGNQVFPNFSPNINDQNATVSRNGLNYGCYDFVWIIDYSFCSVSDTVEVCFFEEPTANAGINDSVCGLTYTLGATRSVGGSQGLWQAISPGLSFNQQSGISPQVTATNYGDHLITWQESNGPCSDIDTVTIRFIESPVANAGLDQSVCDTILQIQSIPSVGNGYWTSSDPNVIVSNNNIANPTVSLVNGQFGQYPIYWTEENSMCLDRDTVQVGFFAQPVANAGSSDTICGLIYQLQGIASVGLGAWSGPANLSFSDVNLASSTVSSTTYGTYTLVWQESNLACADVDSIQITFVETPISDAGSDQSFCGLQGNIDAIPSVGIGSWRALQPAVTINNPNLANSIVSVTSGSYGTYSLVWEEVNSICSDADTVEISFYEQPISFAGTEDSICDTAIYLAAQPSVGIGNWTILNGNATLDNNQDPLTRIRPASYGPITLVWEEQNNICSDKDTVTIWTFEPPFANAGEDGETCGYVYDLSAKAPVGIGAWKGPAGSFFSPVNSESSTVDISNLGYGTYTFIWTDDNAVCEDVDSVQVTFLDVPEVTCDCQDRKVLSTDPYVTFDDYSPRAVSWYWEFGDGGTSTEKNPEHLYTRTGTYDVQLTITDKYNCENTYQLRVVVEENLRFFVPNAFSPNGDNINDEFELALFGHVPGTFKMDIIDRWGKIVYSTNDPNKPWTGLDQNGRPVSMGVFAVNIEFLRFNGAIRTYQGSVTLIKQALTQL